MKHLPEPQRRTVEHLFIFHGFTVYGIRAVDGAALMHSAKTNRYVQVDRNGIRYYPQKPNFADYNAIKPETDGFHLYGFSTEEEEEVFNRITR